MFSTLRTRFGISGLLSALALFVAFAIPATASAAPLGSITEFNANPGTTPEAIAAGPDGNLWYTDGASGHPAIDRITPTGTITEFTLGLNPGSAPLAIAPGADGNVWFADQSGFNENQSVTVAGATDGDTFTLGNLPAACTSPTTGSITYSSTVSTLKTNIQAALDAKCTAGNTSAAAFGSPPVVEFIGAFATTDQQQMTCSVLTGAGTCAIATTHEGRPSAIGRVTPNGSITEFSAGLNPGSQPGNFGASLPGGIAPGPDGNIWFTDDGPTKAIGKITPTGTITEFSAGLNPGAYPNGIAPGPDGNLWFTDQGATAAIGKITPTGTITEFSAGLPPGSTPGGLAGAIAPGPDGNIWFTDQGAAAIGKITPTGTITEFSDNPGSTPLGIAAGPDGNLWFADAGNIFGGASAIGRITPTGTITEFSAGLQGGGVGFPSSSPLQIAAGPDGNLWFTDGPFTGNNAAIGRIGAGAPAASIRPPSVNGTAQVGTQQVCGGDRWATWAGEQPADSAFTSPPAVQWLKDGVKIAGQTARTYTPVAGDLGHSLSCTAAVTYPEPLNVTVAATGPGATVLAQNSGPTGPTGPTGPAGSNGTNGTNGATGAQGSQGPAGAQGLAGPQGPSGKVTCKVKGKKVTCTVKTVAKRAQLRWSLRRGGHTYAHGTTSGRRLRLHLGHLAKGRYLLHLQGSKGGTVIVVS